MKKTQNQSGCNSCQGSQINPLVKGCTVLKSLFSEIFCALGNLLLFMGGDDSVELTLHRLSNKIVKQPTIANLRIETNGEIE